jgi:hypothetical protein
VRWAGRVAAAGRLSTEERGLLLQATPRLLAVRLALRGLGYRRTHDLLARRLAAGPLRAEPATARLIAEAVDRAGRHAGPPAGCLARSLTLWWLLRARGLEADLWIGVRRAEAALEAHAWVEHAGLVINDRPDVRTAFSAFERPVAPSGLP